MTVRAIKPEEFFIEEEPYYEPVGDELMVFEAAYKNQLPVLLKGNFTIFPLLRGLLKLLL